MDTGHLEFFGPDLSRGPYSAAQINTSALQIATALAQLRAPLGRSADDVRNHATFIRELADMLAPDSAVQIGFTVGNEIADTVQTTIAAITGAYSVLDCWLADSVGGGLTTTLPATLSFSGGTVLETVVLGKRYIVLTPLSGLVTISVGYGGPKSWYWGVSRGARAYYSGRLGFA
jgi:hypothetical protein